MQSVASAVQELSSSVAEISRQLTASSAVATKAVGDAEHTDTLAALAGAASRKQIRAVTEEIREIAAKTNLLPFVLRISRSFRSLVQPSASFTRAIPIISRG